MSPSLSLRHYQSLTSVRVPTHLELLLASSLLLAEDVLSAIIILLSIISIWTINHLQRGSYPWGKECQNFPGNKIQGQKISRPWQKGKFWVLKILGFLFFQEFEKFFEKIPGLFAWNLISRNFPATGEMYLGLSPTCLYSSSSICMFPPPHEAPIRKPAFRDDKSWAQIRSVSSSSSGDCSELTYKNSGKRILIVA